MPDLTTQLSYMLSGLIGMPSPQKGAVVCLGASGLAVSTIADTNPTTLFSCTIRPPVFSVNNQGFILRCAGFAANNGNTKTVTITLGSDSYTVFSGAVTNVSWWAEMEYMRRSSNVQIRTGRGGFGSTPNTCQTTTAAETDSANMTLSIIGLNGVASAGDIRLDMAKVLWTPAEP